MLETCLYKSDPGTVKIGYIRSVNTVEQKI